MNNFIPPENGEMIFKTIVNKGLICYPASRYSLRIWKEESIKTIKLALEHNEKIFIVPQKNEYDVEPDVNHIHKVGVVARIEAFKKFPDENLYNLVVFCEDRAEIKSIEINDDVILCFLCEKPVYSYSKLDIDFALEKLWNFVDRFLRLEDDQYLIPNMRGLKKSDSLDFVVDYIISHICKDDMDRLKFLAQFDPVKRSHEFQQVVMRIEASKQIDRELYEGSLRLVREEERRFLLREKLRIIQRELSGETYSTNDGSSDEDEFEDDESGYLKKISKADLPAEVREKLNKEASKLEKMHFGSSEANVIYSYLDVCLEIPWNKSTVDCIDIKKAKQILEKQHYGMKKVKERVIEYLSVKLLSDKPGSQIICLLGAPGVGKTSIASSVAEAMGKKFARVSLGGIRDEADIRGHRKTYVGSMPGRIISAIKNAGVNNPLILLDEIDKMTSDSRGDPASALLEVLDSEQNKGFRDHYLELPFDLSKCFFIATANTLSTVPKPLLDRMEVIELESYTDIEKLEIARRYLVPKQLKRHGLDKTQVSFANGAIKKIIDGYTREAGVRNLEREIASVCRKCAKLVVEGEIEKIKITPQTLEDHLGPPMMISDRIFDKDPVGCVNGLAWTSVGGELMKLEAVSMIGNGKVELTGSLGAVMKESAMIALSYIRKHAIEYGVDPEFNSKRDIHIHAPEGAVPKDGPSAGIAMTTAIISELSGKRIKRDVAMTGEITLTGRVLPIGGLKEKTIAAYKAGVKVVILPKENEKDILKLDDFIKEKIEFKYVSDYREVFDLAFAD